MSDSTRRPSDLLAAGATVKGSVAIVTGSVSGIGRAIAVRLADAGCSVLVNSVSSVEEGVALATELPDAEYVQADIRSAEDCARLVACAQERWGRLDLLVNNAGTTRVIPHSDLDGADLETWKAIFDVNVFGTWSMVCAAVPAMRASGGGTIINVSSVAGARPTGSSIPYAVSKAAVDHMTRALAKALGPDIRVNAVAPGMTDSRWTADWIEQRERVAAEAPLRRLSTPADVADVAVALATATYVTGVVVPVDGGLGLVT